MRRRLSRGIALRHLARLGLAVHRTARLAARRDQDRLSWRTEPRAVAGGAGNALSRRIRIFALERLSPMNTRLALLAAVLAALLAGCSTRESSNVYKAGEAQREQTVRFGTVESVRPVQIQGQRSQVGA